VRTRQAVLKSEYQDWYPWVKPGLWYRAGWLTELVLRQRQSIEPRWEAEFRVPSDRHFTFRGGEKRRVVGARTRRSDTPEAYRVLRIPRPSRPQPRVSAPNRVDPS
jgi:hypothetical protein